MGAPNTIPIPTYPNSGGVTAAVTIADGANVTQGAIADAAVSTDANGTVNAHIRGLVKLLASLIGTVLSPSTNVLTVQGATSGAAVTVATASGTPVVVQENTYAGVANGVLVPGASAANFPSVVGHLYYITAAKANTGTIYLGTSNSVTSTIGSTNTTTGIELQAGQSIGPLPLTNLNDLWAKATVSTDALTYLVL